MDFTKFDFWGFERDAVLHPERHRAYWRSKSLRERLSAIELMRQIKYLDYDPNTPVARTIEIVPLKSKDEPCSPHPTRRTIL